MLIACISISMYWRCIMIVRGGFEGWSWTKLHAVWDSGRKLNLLDNFLSVICLSSSNFAFSFLNSQLQVYHESNHQSNACFDNLLVARLWADGHGSDEGFLLSYYFGFPMKWLIKLLKFVLSRIVYALWTMQWTLLPLVSKVLTGCICSWRSWISDRFPIWWKQR